VASDGLRAYLDSRTGAEVEAAVTLRALDAAITAAEPRLVSAVKYKILMYAFPGDWRHWVCAISANRGGSALRFLYGVIMEDPRRVLRPGSSTLMTWDFGNDEEIDPAAVGDYVREAVAKHARFRSDAKAINERARATAAERMAAHRRA
jgi:hypothetical protein